MKNNIISLYFTRKKKILFEYVTLISSIVNMDDKKLWSKRRDSNTLVKRIIDVFVDNYIYKNTSDKEYILKYMNYNTDVNVIVNLLVTSIIDIYTKEGKTEKLTENRNELLLLAILISCAVELDYKTSSVIEDNIDIHYIRKLINEIVVKKTKFKLFKNTKKSIKKLAEKIKENNKIEKNVFKEIENIDINTYYITYSDKDNYYLFKQKLEIEGLKTYGKFDVDTVAKNENIYNKSEILAINKLTIVILKSIILNNDNYYVLEFEDRYKTPAILNKIDKTLFNKAIKNRVYFLIKNDNKESVINTLKGKDYKYIIDYKDIGNVKSRDFEENTTYLIKDEFIKNNNDNIELFEDRNIVFQIKREFDLYEEKEVVKEIK